MTRGRPRTHTNRHTAAHARPHNLSSQVRLPPKLVCQCVCAFVCVCGGQLQQAGQIRRSGRQAVLQDALLSDAAGFLSDLLFGEGR